MDLKDNDMKQSPRKAKTLNQVAKLNCDNKSFGKTDILVSNDHVSIWPETKTSDNWITISKRDFNRMIDWYNKEQIVK